MDFEKFNLKRDYNSVSKENSPHMTVKREPKLEAHLLEILEQNENSPYQLYPNAEEDFELVWKKCEAFAQRNHAQIESRVSPDYGASIKIRMHCYFMLPHDYDDFAEIRSKINSLFILPCESGLAICIDFKFFAEYHTGLDWVTEEFLAEKNHAAK